MLVDSLSAISLKNNVENEISIDENFEVSPPEPDTSITQVQEEVEKEIEFTFERPEELQKEIKEDQPSALVNPPSLPQLFIDFDIEVEDKEQSKTFNTTGTLMLDSQ
ncbi:hypothetical protein Scep_009963 [Stephania cephalantha]|uniref:Uncharacterized protein n=1 Tax=Stephania cephalantha TaxID=152367 RepID=A0AAP0JWL9_9MAGN